MVSEQRRPSRLPCCRRCEVGVVNGTDLTKDELSRSLQMEEKIDELEEKLDQKNERIEEQHEQIEEQQERIERLETRLRKYENPHTPPRRATVGDPSSPTEQDDEDDDIRTDGGTPGSEGRSRPRVAFYS